MLQHIPNFLTILRILLVAPIVFFIYKSNYGAALACVLIAGLSDALDGLLARKFNWESRFGSIADPLADKLLLISCFIILVYFDFIPFWLLGLILFRDIYVVIGALSYHYVLGAFTVTPQWSGKLNSFMQILLVLSILIQLNIGIPNFSFINVLIYTVGFVCLISIIQYSWTWGYRAQQAIKDRWHE